MVVLSGKIEAELAGLSEDEARDFRAELGHRAQRARRTGRRGLRRARADDVSHGRRKGSPRVDHSARHEGARRPPGAFTVTSSAASFEPRSCRTTTTSRIASMEALRAAGLVRSEGRDYVMREGDVVNFRFNVVNREAVRLSSCRMRRGRASRAQVMP